MAKLKFNLEHEGQPSRTWASTHGMYIAGRSWIDEADATALEMERKWGIGRLRLLVSPELRERFDRQRYLFNQVIWHGTDLEDVRREAGRMVKGWFALDKAAAASGHQPAAPEAIECTLEDGTVAAIVPDNAPAEAVRADGRKVVVYTASEIARLLTAYPTLAKVKAAFPGATVMAIRQISDPLDAFSDSSPGIDEPWPNDALDDLQFGA